MTHAPRRRLLLGSGALTMLAMAGCKTAAPLVPLNRMALLPVKDAPDYSIDERDIVSRQPPPGAGVPVGAAQWAVEIFRVGQAKQFSQAIASRNPQFADYFRSAVARRLADHQVAVLALSDVAAAEEARRRATIATLSNEVDAFVDLTLSAVGYRTSLANAAYTPEIYVEFDVVSKGGRSIDGANYTYDIRSPDGDDRQLQAPADQLIARPVDLVDQPDAVIRNIRSGLDRIADRVVTDILIIKSGKPLP